MNCEKVGSLILKLRKEKSMTQKQVADLLNISDKTVSKWERGLGCPDISILTDLSKIFDINIEKILLGDLNPNDVDGGNMKRIKFYVCPNCGNIISTTGEGEISCCGRKLKAAIPSIIDENHKINIEEVENDYYITIDHEMSKEHYISFAAYVTYDRVLLIKLYPEQSSTVRFPRLIGKFERGKFYIYCTQHGLLVNGK
ncbi:MAG: helix-turn-helix domain-containing protein [Terrisporobacter othiniensis]|uniref:helix-turn-helix domain-containing protein n=1 Tax=Terrisporobacter petrolearius TaxID=1460447 RepID=UPI0022E8BDDF|nr:helix-turn-helix domain-containing protein [Terrisporobacter petrolearius]MDU4862942.1 helix-turn-helix domain-containing protein [Terrisporobacter othiniensis]MDU6996902.1 helix-turn-helix domain-containing protein [Terrisporobacter othiniensis]